MANEEQLKILLQGMKVWSQWRKEHLDEDIDLTGAHLAGANLREADLRGVDLDKTDLARADLVGANLTEAELIEAHLERATLAGATLTEADLTGAHLERATLEEADLRGADLRGAELWGANLQGADLREADLQEADLQWAVLPGADLRGANLIEVDLREADLQEADLRGTNLSNATITGAYLFGTACHDWIIDGITCDYMYWDNKPYFLDKEQEEQWEQEHRTPKDRDFRPGEFEELYKQLPSFDYYFEQGFTLIDIAVMDKIVQAINEQQPEIDLKLTSFDSRGTPHATFTVLHKDYAEDALNQIKADYETQIKVLEGKNEELRAMFATFFDKALQAD